MADLLVAWVACPALLLALWTGTGLGVRAAAGRELPVPLAPACGLATSLAVGAVLAGLAPALIAPGIVVLAALGALVGWRSARRPPWPALAAFAAAFVLYAAPIVLSGEATFAGYIKLDDTATWLAITDRVMSGGGLDTAGLAPSTYEATLAINFENGYPVGGFIPLGVAAEVLGTDPAWLFQPYLALLGALLVPALWVLAGGALRHSGMRALAAGAAALPAILVGYYLWGGLKELLTATLLASLVACAGALRPGRPGRGALAGIAVVAIGMVAAASAGSLIWAAPGAGYACWVLWRRGAVARHVAVAGGIAVGAGAAVIALAAPLSPFRRSFTRGDELGNLAAPLEPAQVLGIWPASDFRFDPGWSWAPYALMAVVALAGGAGVVAAARRRDAGLLVYSVGAIAVWAAVVAVASPWIGAKAYAIAAPAVLLAALCALGRAAERREWWALAALVLVTGGIAWSAVTQWGGANLAPRAQLAELERIGAELEGEGPTLMTEYQPYGVRHFLRAGDPEGASELRRRTVPLADGGTVAKARWADTDELAPAALDPYRTLVLRRSPAQSRPPGAFRRVEVGEFYEVWRRHGRAEPVARLSLGRNGDPGAVPACGAVARLARAAGSHGRLRAAPAGPAPISTDEPLVRFRAREGEYEVWLGDSIRGRAELRLDAEPVADRRHRLNYAELYTSFGAVALDRGRQRLAIELGGADLHPGSAPDGSRPEPLVVEPLGATAVLHVVPAGRARAVLCGRRWDWIEALSGRGE